MPDDAQRHKDDDEILQAVECLDDDDKEGKVIAFAGCEQIPGGVDGVASEDDGHDGGNTPEDADHACNNHPAPEGLGHKDSVEKAQDAELGECDRGHDENGVHIVYLAAIHQSIR